LEIDMTVEILHISWTPGDSFGFWLIDINGRNLFSFFISREVTAVDLLFFHVHEAEYDGD